MEAIEPSNGNKIPAIVKTTIDRELYHGTFWIVQDFITAEKDHWFNMGKKRILFLCRHNSGRSQIAEAFLNDFAGSKFYAESAGLEPTPMIHPLVKEVMYEAGFDISAKKVNSVFEFFKEGRLYDYVITLCENSGFEQCPVFPGFSQRLHWPFPDPEKLEGTHDQKLSALRDIRDAIKEKIIVWLETEH